MKINPPRYHDFEDTYELEQFSCPWEISMPEEDSLMWSIVMPYLMLPIFREENNSDNFEHPQKAFVCDLTHFKKVRNIVYNFNPFLEPSTIFLNTHLKEFVETLKKKSSELENDSNSYDLKIDRLSKLLKVFIKVHNITGEDVAINVKEFPLNYFDQLTRADHQTSTKIHGNSEYSFINNGKITIYCRQSNESTNFHFRIGEKEAYRLKKIQFSMIIKQANIENSDKLFVLQNKRESFVISVIKNEEMKNLVPMLYKGFHTAWKLSDAGFQMDPKVFDKKGFSAFYYALNSGNEEIIIALHSYAVNVYNHSKITYRNPDSVILENLNDIKAVVTSDINKSGNTNQLFRANQLLRFTEFLHDTCEEIMSVRKSTETNSEVIQRKSLILAILKMFVSFFTFDKLEINKTDEFCVSKYFKYENYYKSLDFSTTLFFFDNIFLLKERLRLESGIYSDMESSFLLCVLLHKIFSNDPPPHLSKQVFKFIPLFGRLNLHQEVLRFSTYIEQRDVSKYTLRKIQEQEVNVSLANLQEVKDEFMISRLQYYLKTALKQKVASVKQTLIVERALQVLGETLLYGSNNRKSACFLLFISIPNDTYILLKQIRNHLSHMNEYTFTPKIKAEKMPGPFTEILSDLEKVNRLMYSVFSLQDSRLEDFLLKHVQQEMKDIIDQRNHKDIKLSQMDLSNAYKQIRAYHKDLHQHQDIPHKKNIILQNPYLLENLSRVTDQMIEDELTVNLTQNVNLTETMENFMWPLHFLLPYLAQNDNPKNIEVLSLQANKLLTGEILDDLPSEIKNFWKSYKDLLQDIKPLIKYPQDLISENIEKFRKKLRGFQYLTDNEKTEIRSLIPESIHIAVGDRHKIQKFLEEGGTLSEDQLRQFPQQFLSKTKSKLLGETNLENSERMLSFIKDADDPIKDLDSLLDGKCFDMRTKKFNKLCEHMEFPETIKVKLSELNVGRKRKTSENKLFIIINRVKLLQEILINENTEIQELWFEAQNATAKQYVRYKIMQRYVQDPNVQASTETLLFDCMNLLDNEKVIELLSIKSVGLYNGINLRNVLAHGNPIFGTIGMILDADDLPSSLVDEMLQLIRDENAIQAIYTFCQDTGSDFEKFYEFMDKDEYSDHSETREKITACPQWRKYSFLLEREKEIQNQESTG